MKQHVSTTINGEYVAFLCDHVCAERNRESHFRCRAMSKHTGFSLQHAEELGMR